MLSTSPAKRAPPSPWASERSVYKTQQIGRRRRHPSSSLSADLDGEEALSTSPARRAQPSPWASERSLLKTQPIGRGRRHPSSALSADQDGEEAVSFSYFTGKKGSILTMGIRKVSVQNSADLQGEASAVLPLSADQGGEETVWCCNTSELAINRWIKAVLIQQRILESDEASVLLYSCWCWNVSSLAHAGIFTTPKYQLGKGQNVPAQNRDFSIPRIVIFQRRA